MWSSYHNIWSDIWSSHHHIITIWWSRTSQVRGGACLVHRVGEDCSSRVTCWDHPSSGKNQSSALHFVEPINPILNPLLPIQLGDHGGFHLALWSLAIHLHPQSLTHHRKDSVDDGPHQQRQREVERDYEMMIRGWRSESIVESEPTCHHRVLERCDRTNSQNQLHSTPIFKSNK